MKKVRIAINGFGRIGRAFYKLARTRPELEIVVVNDLGDPENMAYLLKYDTTYGKADFDVEVVGGDEPGFIVGGQKVILVQEKEPTNLPWAKYNIDIVLESTGFFTSYEKSKVHLDAGAKRVVITAPVKDEAVEGITGATVLMGINDDKLSTCQISSNASCTTNAASPLIHILNEMIGIEKALLNTTHAYTGTQKIVDGPGGKDFRGGRAAAQNMIPGSTGAAIAVTEAVPSLTNKFDGIAIRVPVIAGSLADITFIAKRNTSAEEVNQILRDASKDPKWEGIFKVSEEPIVSSDIVGTLYGAIADLELTRVVDGNLVKVMSWYDNEMGYTNTLVKHVVKVAQYL
ncbi:MAG: type I glyceraldehyde-3-phosphate dehydrogenase [Candidatus Yonathbacteria bacterium CG10_big_fil_rev_8_21_14_0_10_43_136]|uniref:Type I glyceraldehyde-3-phosphate dehydrogenase n=1 Tax=Candidatus Yonathbacteria bacterium CG_4_10_14_0_8_um_filter_43_17 TaxID=1975099 RepID=A0A2M7Q6S3_9BACT|nr:MAG: type I glyceraldehyde-3-phosphate dehydrogenase [Candidatus Yonathbacteria bacterium CG17_big_fil_post_rev_8_21_14_2_50_43_9]PIR40996.1 MAG: type I glyceraldehyde-3-phosphate dehydrogenase [Candidatus Yonathbacteria bacterium CG10_big_fil_rev_8_21_14_0_10_43_136]PIX57178.1 MAG: type I glyceraldehyde-3-phosphate dehydrogenase [Candidatus Yonathbacteria bacterium CG_4_10_14_3_um_filter_43_12]PIY58775.1 MAG: type I glyceraldehyde-3-phosphate dehydrogenase [Candidatus Yonathbacteria bacteriu